MNNTDVIKDTLKYIAKYKLRGTHYKAIEKALRSAIKQRGVYVAKK